MRSPWAQAEAVRRTLARQVAGLDEALQRNAQSPRALGQDIEQHLRGMRVDAEVSRRRVEEAVRKPSSSPSLGR